MDDRERHAAGMQVRRAVLGDAHVDRANAAQTDLTAPFQDLITRYAWGEIWTRPGLDARTRRILVIGTLIALGHWDELRMHVRAAIDAGVSAYVVDGLRKERVKPVLELAVRRFNAMFQSVLRSGCYLPPSAYEVLFLSAAHVGHGIMSAPAAGEIRYFP